MNELIEQTVSKEQAQLWTDEIRHSLGNIRYCLLRVRDTKAYLVLGYDSFEAYGQSEFGYERRYLERLAVAAEIQNQLGPIGPKEIPESQLRPLATIPEAERQAIWDEANRKAEESGKERTAKMVEEAVKEYQAKLSAAEAKLANAQHSLDYEETIDTLNTQIETLEQSHQKKIDELTAKHKKEFKEQQELLKATQEQRDRLIAESNERITRLEKALTEARKTGDKDAIEAAKTAVEDEIANGSNAKIAELERRANQYQSRVDDLIAKSAELEKQYGVDVRSSKTLEKINMNLLTISTEIAAFQLEMEEMRSALSDEQITQWRKFQNQYSNGLVAIENIIDLWKTK
jgi:uncharacterized protein YeeX (DUF496 family)